MKHKPHIKREGGLWFTSLLGEVIYCNTTIADAFRSAQLVWEYQ